MLWLAITACVCVYEYDNQHFSWSNDGAGHDICQSTMMSSVLVTWIQFLAQGNEGRDFWWVSNSRLSQTCESDVLSNSPRRPYPAMDILICKTQLINCISDLYHTSTAYSHVHNWSTKHTECVTQQSINQTYRTCNSTIDQPNIQNV